MRRSLVVKIAIAVLVVAAVAVGVAQLVLPGIAERIARQRVARYGEVERVTVHAVPAIELLWGKADSVDVAARRMSISPKALVNGLVEAGPIGKLSVHVGQMTVSDGIGGEITVSDASLRKDGQSVSGSAVLTQRALSTALPAGVQATIVPSKAGRLEVLASGELFGFTASVSALVHASEGQLLLTPIRPLIARLAELTLFSDPRLEVLHVEAAPQPGAPTEGSGQAWILSGKAVLR